MPASLPPEEGFLRAVQHPSVEQCPTPECTVCGERDCPHGEPLHYHHDGCPACETENREWEAALKGIRKIQRAANGLSLQQFCGALDWEVDSYSKDKWQQFQQIGGLHRFDDGVLRKLWETQP
jgi:hypothetical protein